MVGESTFKHEKNKQIAKSCWSWKKSKNYISTNMNKAVLRKYSYSVKIKHLACFYIFLVDSWWKIMSLVLDHKLLHRESLACFSLGT